MVTGSFRLGLTIVVLGALIAYHITNIFLVNPLGSDWFSLAKLVQLAATAAGFYLALDWQIFTQIVLGILQRPFIGGRYVGESLRVSSAVPQETQEMRTLRFEIKHTFLETQIAGASYQADGQQVSSWNGPLFSQIGKDYCFALHLFSDYGEYGILKLTFEGDRLNGQYWSGDSLSPGLFKLSARRVKGQATK